MRLLGDETEFNQNVCVFDDCRAVKACDIGNGLVGRVTASGVSVLMLLEDSVHGESVCTDNRHEVIDTVINAGMGCATFQDFFLELAAAYGTLI